MYDTTLSQKYGKDMGLCRKKIKDAYPKKVCVAEPPKLIQLKCANHHPKGNPG